MFRYPFGFWYDGEMAGLAAAGRVARATRADTAEPALMVHTKAAQVTRIPTLGRSLNTTPHGLSFGELIHHYHSQHPGRRRDTRDSGDDLLRAEAELLAGLVAR